MHRRINRRDFLCGCSAIGAAAAAGFAHPGHALADEHPIFTPPPDDENYLDNVDDALRSNARAAREEFRKNMTDDQLDIESSIKYIFHRTDLNNAFAHVDAGVRKIEMFDGTMRAVEQIATARELSLMPETSSAASGYIRYVADEIQKRMADPIGTAGLPPIKAAWDYVGVQDKNMAAVLWNKYPKLRQQFEMECACSIAFVVGHEIGHHLAGHVFSRAASLEDQRQRESEADDWAIALSKGSSVPVIGSMPIFISFALFDPEAQHHEFKLDHPAAFRRAENALEKGGSAMLGDPKFVQYLNDTGQLDAFKKQLQQSIDQLKSLLAD